MPPGSSLMRTMKGVCVKAQKCEERVWERESHRKDRTEENRDNVSERQSAESNSSNNLKKIVPQHILF